MFDTDRKGSATPRRLDRADEEFVEAILSAQVLAVYVTSQDLESTA